MTNEEKARLYALATRCATCMARYNDFGFECEKDDCTVEHTKNFDWLMQDHEAPRISEGKINEPPVDWTKVEIDTLIEVSDDGERWHKRYFAKYECGLVSAWADGRTSKTINTNPGKVDWIYARLIEE